MAHATNETTTVVLRLAGMDRRGNPHFLDEAGGHWRATKAPYFDPICSWCDVAPPPHSDIVVTPPDEGGRIMHDVCLRHVRIDACDGTDPVPAADWFARQPQRAPQAMHYDGGQPTVTTWEELDDWAYDIEERMMRLNARDQELRAREAEGTATREEIGAWMAARRAVHREYGAMYGIRKFTMDAVRPLFQGMDDTLGDIARREGWPSATPPLVFPPPDWQAYPDDDSNEDE